MRTTRRGRPPLDRDDPSQLLHLRIPSKQYAATTTQALRERLTRAEWVRRTLRAALDKPHP